MGRRPIQGAAVNGRAMERYEGQWGKRYHFDNVYDPLLELSRVKLLQAGEIIAGDGYVIEEHEQVCPEISYVVSGHCDFYEDGKVFHAAQGDLHVVGRGVRHMIVAGEQDNLRMAYIAFRLRPCPGWEALEAFYRNPPRELRNDLHFSRLLFEQLLYEIYAARPCAQEAMDSWINQILIHVYRVFHCRDEGESRRIVEEARLERIMGHTILKTLRHIDSNLNRIGSISQIAEELKYNPAYLSRIFRERTGMTMQRYIAEKKVEAAKALLEEGVSVSEAAVRLGYGSSQSFCKMFSRCEGCAPTQYLRRKRETDVQSDTD